MSRQQYETKQDLTNEKIAAEKWLNDQVYPLIDECEIIKLGDKDPADFLIKYVDGKPICLLEIKCRKMSYFQYDTIMISRKKYENLSQLSREKQLPAYIVWHLQNDDSMVFTNVTNKFDFSEIGGRTVKTRDAWDVEEMVHWSFLNIEATSDTPSVGFEVLK